METKKPKTDREWLPLLFLIYGPACVMVALVYKTAKYSLKGLKGFMKFIFTRRGGKK